MFKVFKISLGNGLNHCKPISKCFEKFPITDSEAILNCLFVLQAVTASIKILDVRDFAPRFEPNQVTLTLSEASPVGTTRNLELAIDNDSPEFGVKR